MTWLDSTFGEVHIWKLAGFVALTLFVLIEYSYDAFQK